MVIIKKMDTIRFLGHSKFPYMHHYLSHNKAFQNYYLSSGKNDPKNDKFSV